MSLPAARIAVPHVDSAGEPRSCGHARADKEVRGVLWRSEPEHGSPGDVVLPRLQRPDVRGLSAPLAAPSSTRQAHGPGARQRRLPPYARAQTVAAQAPAPAELVLPATVQPATVHDRTGLETHSAPGHAQPALPDAVRRLGCGHGMLSALAASERNAAPAMLYYLRRCV